MDVRQLRALLAVADTGSVTRAAEALHLVQPAVSRQLKLLEEDIGLPLFSRERYGMALTEAGEILVEHARRALIELDRARAELLPADAEVGGPVTIGLLPSTADLLCGPLTAAVRARYPSVNFRLSVGYAGHLREWIESGETDAALLYNPKPSPTIQTQALLEEQLCLVYPPNAPVPRQPSVSIEDLAQWPMILPSAPHGIRNLLEQACPGAGVRLQVVVETNAMSVQKRLAESGLGCTILPSIAVKDDVASGALCATPIDAPALQRTIVLALPTTRRVAVAVRCVTALLIGQMKTAVEQGDWPTAQWVGS